MQKMDIRAFTLGPVGTNFYIAVNKDTKEALLIDPADQAAGIESYLRQNQLQPVAILLTHGHFDHIMAVNELKASLDLPVYAHEDEEEVLKSVRLNMSNMIGARYVSEADFYLKDGDTLELAGFHIIVYHTPGHTRGGCCFYIPDEKVLFSGDTLFNCSIGRTDFPTGSMSVLVRSIKEKLFVLPDDVVVYQGHEGVTNIGFEKQHNPFLQ